MTGAQFAAGAGGATAVLAAWEVIGVVQAAGPARRVGALLAPLRGGAGRGGEDVSVAERRRLIALLAATLFGAGWLLAGPVAATTACTAGPWLVGRAIAVRRRRWRRAMGEGAPVAARAMADALAGGHSVRSALAGAAAGGGGDAVNAELRRAAAALALGARTEAVLDALRAVADGPAWDTIVAAILLQREAGGDLAALLRELAGELEAAGRVEADARAATAQARFTAGTVAVLPIVAAGLAELAAPGTLAAITGNPIALALAAVAVVLQAAGLVVVRGLARGLEV